MLAVERGERRLRGVLCARRRSYDRIRLFKDVDRVFLGGILRQVFRSFSRGTPAARRIDVVPPKD
jgi:hypothetical protein